METGASLQWDILVYGWLCGFLTSVCFFVVATAWEGYRSLAERFLDGGTD
jgi:hypothetical protein